MTDGIEFRRPDADDPFEQFLVENARRECRIAAVAEFPEEGNGTRCYLVVHPDEVRGPDASVYRVWQPYGTYFIFRHDLTVRVADLCRDRFPDGEAPFRMEEPVRHDEHDAAFHAKIGGHPGVVWRCAYPCAAAYLARVARIGRPEELVFAFAGDNSYGKDERRRLRGSQGLLAHEIGEGYRLEVLLRTTLGQFRDAALALGREPEPTPVP